MLNDLLFRLRALFRRKTVEAELDDELRLHFDFSVQKYERSGLSREEALRRARLEFGGMGQVKEECREARGVHFMEELFQDVRYGLRMLRKSPGFTAVALLTLALGIGANTAIFSVVYGVLLRPLPYKDSDRLIVLNETTPKVGQVSVSYPNFLDWRSGNRSFSQMAAVAGVSFNLAGVDQPENINGEAVSPYFLSMLGVRPILGRDFAASEEKAGTVPVALLSYQLWQSHLGGSASALGRTINLNGKSFTIIGVLPPDFVCVDKTDIMVPIGVWLTGNSDANSRGDRGDMAAIGRLGPGVSFAQAQAEMQAIAARLAISYPGPNDQFSAALRPIREVFVGEIRPAILILFGAVLFVLLIACANVANLFLMRGAARTREIALRIALGATRGRIVRQMLAESFVLAFLGGLLGLAVSIAGIRGLARLIPMDGMSGGAVNMNGMVLLFAAAAVVVSAFVFGLVPAMNLTKPDVQPELKEGGRSASSGTGQNRLRGLLAAGEVAVALILLVGAGLMVKSLYRLLAVDPGFKTDRILTMEMQLRSAQYSKDPAILNFWQQVLYRVRALPGVESAALGTVVPLTDSHSRSDITIEGMALPKPGSFPHPDGHSVSPGYLRTLGVPLLRGREFTDADQQNSPLVGMVNAAVARQFFPNQDVLGKRFMFGHPSTDPPKWITIVGVAADTKLYGLANPARLEVYLPLRQSVLRNMDLVVKSAADPAALTSSIRGAIASIDKDQPIFAIATMQELVKSSISTRRITLILLGLFSALALILAAIGIYGVISYSVAQRTHEIGIRMALGADGGGVLRMILAQGVKIAGAGVGTGILASFGLTRLMTKLLYSVSSADPITFAAVAIVLVVVAMLACYIPARRALRVDPIIALRYE
ncbi:MAG TPA: ABC transporter permease [Bryobacteraceae bacterium]|nr:ABC transporter permease [Bryobacteraceae bacterium]